jgi:mRNA interferase RelE/StbE
MAYTVIIKKSAQKQITAIPGIYIPAIEKSILALANNPRPAGCKKLAGSKNIYRVRVGIYRIVYEVHDKIVTVFIFDVDHRKQVYR